MEMENTPGRARTPWTIEDVRYLETHYGVKKTREIAAYLNRSATAVRAMAYLVGITTPVAADWSETEIEIVCRDYPAGVALADICARLNGRAPKSVCWMARWPENAFSKLLGWRLCCYLSWCHHSFNRLNAVQAQSAQTVVAATAASCTFAVAFLPPDTPCRWRFVEADTSGFIFTG